MPYPQRILEEFTRLRHGWGVMSPGLTNKIGPALAELCGLSSHDSDLHARRKILALTEGLAEALTDLERTSVRYALGQGKGLEHARLDTRIKLLAEELTCSPRTARRRVDEAFRTLAQQAAQIAARADADRDDPERGWTVDELDALLRLDLRAPELIETRKIVALRDGLKKITARVSLPRRTLGEDDDRDLDADAQQGARIEATERQGQSHYRYLLDLPRPLAKGETHSYTLVFRVPEGRLASPHYAFVPLIACSMFKLKIRFDPAQRPDRVWRLDRLFPRLLDEGLERGNPLPLDDAFEVAVRFDTLDVGFAYGVAWQLSSVDAQ
jgi:hypothetical protein